MRPKQWTALKKLFSLPPTPDPQDKILRCLWDKHFLTKICRNIQIFFFKELQERSSLGCQEMAECKCFFLTHQRNMFAGNFVKWEGFLVVFQEHLIFNVKWIELHKMSEVFWAKLYCKVTLNDSFCWQWDFPLENLKYKKNSDDVHWNV